MSQEPRECNICGAPILGDTCNYCGANELLKQSFNKGKCQNCSASLDVLRDKDGWLCCRYCGWPIRKDGIQKIEEAQTKPVLPNQEQRRGSHLPDNTIIVTFGVFIIIMLIPLLMSFSTSGLGFANVTSASTSKTAQTPSPLYPLLQLFPWLFLAVGAIMLFRVLKGDGL